MLANIRHNPLPVAVPYRGIYSHGVEVPAGARQLHVSGQIGFTPDGQLPADFSGQCRHAIHNIETVLVAAHMSLQDVVQMRFYLINMAHMDELVAVRKELLEGVAPAITTYQVAGLVDSTWLIEVEALAAKQSLQTDGLLAKML